MTNILTQGATKDDITRLREIAEAGRHMPLLGGRHMVVWGSAVALASVVHGAIATEIVKLPPISIAAAWFAIMLAAAAITRLPAFNTGISRDATDMGNRIERAVWQVGGAFLGLSALGIFTLAMVMVQKSGDASYFRFFAMMPTLTFGVYAIILRAAAETSGVGQLRSASWIALVFAVGCILLIGLPSQFILSAMGALLVSVMPGLRLIKLENGGHNGQ